MGNAIVRRARTRPDRCDAAKSDEVSRERGFRRPARLDLIGLKPDCATGREIVSVCDHLVDAQRQQKLDVKLMGV